MFFDDLNATDEIRLFVRAVSGDEEFKFAIPPETASPIDLTPGAEHKIDRSLFGVDSAGGTLLLEIIAVEIDNPAESQLLFNLFLGAEIGLFDALQAAQSTERTSTVIGSYQGLWTKADDWGSGSYEAVGDGDLRLWFDVLVEGFSGRSIIGRPFPTPTPTATPTATPLPTGKELRWFDSTTGEPTIEISSGNAVTLVVQTTADNGAVLMADVYEVDESLGLFHFFMGQVRLTVRDGFATGTWNPEWFFDLDTDADPEFRFELLGEQSPILTVTQ